MSRPLAALVEDLLARVAGDCPAALRAIGERAAGLTVAVRVGPEDVALDVDARGPRVRAWIEAPATRVEATLPALRALVMGDDEVVEALVHERVRAFGAPADLAKLDALVRLLVAGAARTHGTEPLLDEFLGTL